MTITNILHRWRVFLTRLRLRLGLRMPIRKNVGNKVDAFISGIIGDISSNQLTYKGINGNYKIERPSHDTLPENGQDTRLEKQWDVYALPPDLPCAISIDSYRTPDGDGFYVTAKLKDNNKIYIKRYHGLGNSPDVADFADWTEVSQ